MRYGQRCGEVPYINYFNAFVTKKESAQSGCTAAEIVF